MAGNDVQKYDGDLLVQKLREKVKHSLIGLIPDEAIEEMVKTEVTKFERDELPKLIQAEIKELYTAKAKGVANEVIDKYCSIDWKKEIKGEIKSELEKFILENSGKILANMIVEPLTQQLSVLTNQMYNSMPKICGHCQTVHQPNYSGSCSNCGQYIS